MLHHFSNFALPQKLIFSKEGACAGRQESNTGKDRGRNLLYYIITVRSKMKEGEGEMSTIIKKEIETEQELKEVLELCYDILTVNAPELYGYDAWHKRFLDGLQPLVYAMKDEQIVSAILGRAENKDSLVIGFAACRENYRRQGITKELLGYFEDIARKKGFKCISLGSEEDAFYEKCGYKIISQVHGQNIFQKKL